MGKQLAFIEQFSNRLIGYFEYNLSSGFELSDVMRVFDVCFGKNSGFKMHLPTAQLGEKEYIKSFEGKEIFYIEMITSRTCNCDCTIFTKSVSFVYSIGNIIIRRNLILAKDRYKGITPVGFYITDCEVYITYSTNECLKHNPMGEGHLYQCVKLSVVE